MELSITQIFTVNVVAVANALPGSILCKILTGIAYDVGYNLNGSVIEGFLVALSGFACSVAASGAIFELVFCVYEKYESLQIFSRSKTFYPARLFPAAPYRSSISVYHQESAVRYSQEVDIRHL